MKGIQCFGQAEVSWWPSGRDLCAGHNLGGPCLGLTWEARPLGFPLEPWDGESLWTAMLGWLLMAGLFHSTHGRHFAFITVSLTLVWWRADPYLCHVFHQKMSYQSLGKIKKSCQNRVGRDLEIILKMWAWGIPGCRILIFRLSVFFKP